MKIRERINAGFFRNPFVWALLVAFLIAEYGSYQNGKKLDQVCDAHWAALTKVHPQTPQEIADSICAARRED